MSLRRRSVATRLALLAGVVVTLLLVWVGVAAADDCSSPEDCSNTAWTVGGGAAVAGGIIAAATVLGPPKVDEDAAEGVSEERISACRELLEPLKAEADRQFRRCADLLGAFHGAVERAAAAEAEGAVAGAKVRQLERTLAAGSSDYETALHTPVAPRAGLWDALDTPPETTAVVGAPGVGLTAIPSSKEAVETWARSRLAVEQARLARLGHQPLTGAARSSWMKAQVAARGSFLRAAGAGANIASAATAVISINRTSQLDDAHTVLGIMAERERMAALELSRWRQWADDRKQEYEEARVAYERAAARYNDAIADQECPFVPIPATFEAEVVRGPTGRPEPVLERPEPSELWDQGPTNCATYAQDLAAYEQKREGIANHSAPDHQRWRQQLGRWAQRRADAAHMAEQADELYESVRSMLDEEVGQKINWTAGGTIVGLASGLLVAASLPLAVALGLSGLIASVAGSGMSPEYKWARIGGALAQRRAFLRRQVGYANSEVMRLRELLLRQAQNLRPVYRHLDQTHVICSSGRDVELPAPTPPPSWVEVDDGIDLEPAGRIVPITDFGRLP